MKLMVIEIILFLTIPLFALFVKKFIKINPVPCMSAGIILGMFNEFATEPLWNYHLKVNIYKDTPLVVVLGWGVLFTAVTLLSEKAYKVASKKDFNGSGIRIIFFDILTGVLLAFPLETILLRAGVWDYRYDILCWNWGNVPFFNMPLEALVGYVLFMSFGPTFVRYWRKRK